MSLLDEQKRKTMIERIGALRPETRAQWGRMNCHQAICHLTDQFRGAMGELEWKDQRNLFVKTVVKFLAVYVIKPPKNIPTMPEVDQEKEGTKPVEFESDRAALVAYVEKFAAAPPDFPWSPHAAFGRMSGRQWDRLSYKHLDHH